MDLEHKSNTQFDKELNEIKVTPNLKNMGYLPWVGKDYADLPAGNKIFILGESAYGDWHNKKDCSREIIIDHAIKKTEGFFRNMYWAICGKETKVKTETFWNQVCFNNIVQVRMVNRSYRPSTSDFENGVDYIVEQIKTLKPALIICFKNWDVIKFLQEKCNDKLNNQNDKLEYKNIEVEDKVGRVMPRILTSGKFKILFIRHASSYFSHKGWHKFINKHAKTNVEFFQNLSVN